MLIQKQRGKIVYYNARYQFITITCIALYLLYTDWIKFIIYWQIPRFIASYCIVTINMLQHDGCEINYTNLNTARNFTGKFLNFWTCNNGYHSIHHTKPGLHWSLLPTNHINNIKSIHPNLCQPNICSYIYKNYIYPCYRKMYDNRPYILPLLNDDKDEDWLEFHKYIKPNDFNFILDEDIHTTM